MRTMNATMDVAAGLIPSRSPIAQGLATMAGRASAAIRARLAARATRRVLAELDPHLCRDIGVTPTPRPIRSPLLIGAAAWKR